MNVLIDLLNDLEHFKKVRVSQLGNKNQFVIEYKKPNNDCVVCFQSYSTLICIYNSETKQMVVNWRYWDYSKTTLKHFKIFVNTFTQYEFINKLQFIRELRNNPLIETY